MLRNSQIGPYAFPGVPAEFTNWRDEQRAWRESCVLFDQSHHMTDLYIEGPDAIRLLSDFGVNSFENFGVKKAKQFVSCNPDGYVIGDGILFHLEENSFSLVGRPTAHNWVQYQAESGSYEVRLERDERSAANPTGRRKLYRYQIQGPNAQLTEKVREIHERSGGTYGYVRVHVELRALGMRCSRKRVARSIRKAALKGCIHGRSKRTTRQDVNAVPAPDLLVKRNFYAIAPNKLWTANIAYVGTREGFVYLAFILDVYSRRVVGWSMANHLRTELVVDALNMALWRRKPDVGLIYHTDRGAQYTALSFGKRLEEAGIVPSMGRVGLGAG